MPNLRAWKFYSEKLGFKPQPPLHLALHSSMCVSTIPLKHKTAHIQHPLLLLFCCFTGQGSVRPRANEHNMLAQNHPTLLGYCWLMLALRPMQTDPTLLATTPNIVGPNNCCDLLRPFARNHNNVGTCCV